MSFKPPGSVDRNDVPPILVRHSDRASVDLFSFVILPRHDYGENALGDIDAASLIQLRPQAGARRLAVREPEICICIHLAGYCQRSRLSRPDLDVQTDRSRRGFRSGFEMERPSGYWRLMASLCSPQICTVRDEKRSPSDRASGRC